jgi:intraflagellar transport protein 57
MAVTRISFTLFFFNSVQFSQFAALTAFLLGLCRRSFTMDKYEDPTTLINRIIGELKALGCELDFPPLKLRQGAGEPVVKVLNALCDKALALRGFAFERPVYPEDTG